MAPHLDRGNEKIRCERHATRRVVQTLPKSQDRRGRDLVCCRAMNTPESPSVSLVLGSGGARGLAHIGAIEVLLERGYRIASISGASMGALVGGIHAVGGLADYRDWVVKLQKLDVLRLLDFTFGAAGLVKGDRIINELRELVGDAEIESLPIRFTAVATDLDTQQEVWLQRGRLFDAVRASIAIPTLFTPHLVEGRLLVDGGLVDPVPIGPTLSDLSDLTVVVDVNGRTRPGPGARARIQLDGEETNGSESTRNPLLQWVAAAWPKRGQPADPAAAAGWTMYQLISRSVDTMQGTITRLKLAAYTPELVISIPTSVCAFYEFYRAAELIEIGREETTRALDVFEANRGAAIRAPA
jgi:NTE family protein